jgi:antitoxin (DNA-binding transcriptional repressor) of toxin-antitoxin stability system
MELLSLVSAGNRVIIEKDKQPLAELVGVSSLSNSKKRVPGLNRGEIEMSKDFDSPLPDEFWLGRK